MEIYKKQSDWENMEYYAGKCRDVVELLDLWQYGKYTVSYTHLGPPGEPSGRGIRGNETITEINHSGS